MTTVFCPGHITCFFRPVITDDAVTTGSVGAGMKISLGSEVTVEERNDRDIRITLNGEPCRARVINNVVKQMAPGRGFDIAVLNDLPVSQGFGMSAAGAIATGTCVASICGFEIDEAFKAAHIAEIEEKGGLGDVLGIMNNGYISIRTKAGMPPAGAVTGNGKRMELTLAVIGEPMNSSNILSDHRIMERIKIAGDEAVASYKDGADIFRTARMFSRDAGLESVDISKALDGIGNEAAMCMLGNSLFTTCDENIVVDVLPDAIIYKCETTDSMPFIRKA